MKMRFVLMFMALSLAAEAQWAGAWKLVSVVTQDGRPVDDRTTIKLYSGNAFIFAQFGADGTHYFSGGGRFSAAGKRYRETLSFFTLDSTQVGKEVTYTYKRKGNRLTIEAPMHGRILTEVWEQLPSPATPLEGGWYFSGRFTPEGALEAERDLSVSRQTWKFVVGNRFQWAAFDLKTKQFFGTGGGSCTVKDGVYTETIEFFSRDKTRAGQSLTFSFSVDAAGWQHKGLSSTGNPIHERWRKIY